MICVDCLQDKNHNATVQLSLPEQVYQIIAQLLYPRLASHAQFPDLSAVLLPKWSVYHHPYASKHLQCSYCQLLPRLKHIRKWDVLAPLENPASTQICRTYCSHSLQLLLGMNTIIPVSLSLSNPPLIVYKDQQPGTHPANAKPWLNCCGLYRGTALELDATSWLVLMVGLHAKVLAKYYD